ncbi:MAG TPA: hypothetical protein VHM19_21400, partial [Polyangiales bacterium]|nr:hypothetical protein [Polyangiales bacterium]
PGNAVIATTCDTTKGYCVYTSQPGDLGKTLATGENGKPYGRVRITLHSDAQAIRTPTLFNWYITYYCLNQQ